MKEVSRSLKKQRGVFSDKFKELKQYWKNYVFQCFLATLTMFLLLLLLSMEHIVVIASIGSTAFIVFAMPKSITAKPRRVIGGHLIGFFSGSLCAMIPHSSFLWSVVVYSLAVGLSVFLMTIADAEHPPASGTALGIVISGFSLGIAYSLVISIVMLSLFHQLFKPVLKDLV
ncbi:HPP family protein [Candidatus Bathyarchaeota archaeon]|nr:MAG: HPP family protein [Candidatus Bathyarchaeota archaeon]